MLASRPEMRGRVPLAPLCPAAMMRPGQTMILNRLGEVLGAGGILVGVAEFVRLQAATQPVYAVSPPITAQQWDQWSPLILSMSSTLVGVFMMVWGRVSANRDERLKTGFKAELMSISDKLDDLDAKIASAKAQAKDGLSTIQEQVSDIAVKVQHHDAVIAAARKRQSERTQGETK